VILVVAVLAGALVGLFADSSPRVGHVELDAVRTQPHANASAAPERRLIERAERKIFAGPRLYFSWGG
jgi:hypothetical protein